MLIGYYHLARDQTVRGTGHLYPPLALSGRLQCGWCWFVYVFDFIALLGQWYPMFFRHIHLVVADRRATAWITETLSHAATTPKKTLDTWYDAVHALPIAWPDITDIETHYFKKTSANQLLALRTQMGVSHMWGEILLPWRLLRHHLWNLGPSCLNAERLEDLLILNQPNRLGKMSRTQFCLFPTGRNGSIAGFQSFVDENVAVDRILQIVCRDKIAMGIT